ncbi:MAG: hypothetical protein HY835_10910, partial [Anaerolineae bacterium]|nr:hypothetical protein [Anaerolineae bacterium]
MDMTMQDAMTNLYSQDRELQTQAYMRLMVGTEQPVDWAYVVWDELLVALRHQDNHVRSIAAQVLCNLAQSDPELRIRKDFAALLAVTRDERFVTARHCLQALWKVGIAGETQRDLVLEGFASRFVECVAEKNASLIRYDIQVGL